MKKAFWVVLAVALVALTSCAPKVAVKEWEIPFLNALTGPIARGDEETVARQREAVAERTPDLLPLWDAMGDATRAVVA